MALIRRLARVVQELLGSSYSHARHEVEIGHVLINEQIVIDPGAVVRDDDQVHHNPNLPRRARPTSAPSIELLHLDDDLVVINKPAGLLVHPTYAGESDTVLSRVAAAIERQTGQHRRVLVVHRIDQDTSGVLVLALNHDAAERLQHQFRAHTIERRYLALVAGDLAQEEEVERKIGRPRPGARLAALGPDRPGRNAVTQIRPIERFGRATLVEAELGTGRTHQVRVHLSYLGHPVLADRIYGDPSQDPLPAPRLALHAAHLVFAHPRTGERLAFHQELPPDMAQVVSTLRRRRRLAEPRAVAAEPVHSGRQNEAATRPPHPRTSPRRGGARRPQRAERPTRRKPAKPHRHE